MFFSDLTCRELAYHSLMKVGCSLPQDPATGAVKTPVDLASDGDDDESATIGGKSVAENDAALENSVAQ